MCLFPVHSCQQAHKIKSAKPLEVLAGLSALSFSLSLSACMQNGSPRLAPLTNSICQKVFLTCRHEIYCFIIYPFFNLKPPASLPLSFPRSLLFLSLLPQVLRVSDNLNEQIEKCCKFLLARYEKSFIICAGAAELNPQKMSIIGVDLLSLRAHLKIFTMTLRGVRWRGGVYGFGLPKIQLCNCV